MGCGASNDVRGPDGINKNKIPEIVKWNYNADLGMDT